MPRRRCLCQQRDGRERGLVSPRRHRPRRWRRRRRRRPGRCLQWMRLSAAASVALSSPARAAAAAPLVPSDSVAAQRGGPGGPVGYSPRHLLGPGGVKERLDEDDRHRQHPGASSPPRWRCLSRARHSSSGGWRGRLARACTPIRTVNSTPGKRWRPAGPRPACQPAQPAGGTGSRGWLHGAGFLSWRGDLCDGHLGRDNAFASVGFEPTWRSGYRSRF